MASSKSRKLNILIVIEYFAPHIGGVERVMEEVGKRLVKYGHNVYVLTTKEKTSVPYHGMNVTRLALQNRYLFALAILPVLFLKFRNVDIVHSANNYSVALPAWIFARVTGKKITMSVWEIWGNMWFRLLPTTGFLHLLYELLIVNLPFNALFVPSKFVVHQLPKKPAIFAPLAGKNLRFSATGRTNLRKRLGYAKNYVFLYFGRLGLSKGVDILETVFNKIHNKYPHTRLYVAKNIPEDQLANYLSMSDCVVIPDIRASFGLNALEASEIGRPIVTTTAGALPEVVFGRVVFAKPGSVLSLVKAMEQSIQKKFLIIPRKRFSWEKTARIYENVLARTPPTI